MGQETMTSHVFAEGQSAHPEMRRTARVTGLLYLMLALAGMIGYVLIRPQIHMAGDPGATLGNLVERPGLARLGVVFELALVTTQALTAVWFYKLFRPFNQVGAWASATFGMVNAVAIMASAAFMATALTVAGDPGMAPGGDVAATTQLLYELSSNSWGVGAIFFGLWLIPMGYVASSSMLMPKWLGRTLMVGGLGYVLSCVLSYGLAGSPDWIEVLVVPATIGEFWMIGYLIVKGVRPISSLGDPV
jgi:hypothetical protein